MDCLRKERRLPPVPKALVWSIPDECVKMVYVNIQGLVAKSQTKKQDSHCDGEIQNVDILCFSETHYGTENSVSAKDIWPHKKG